LSVSATLPTLVVITGPTAAGKSAAALQLAQRWQIPLISADSRQIIRYFNIGTNKPTAEEQALVQHQLIDVIEPDEHFHVKDYEMAAMHCILDSIQQHGMALLVGGTGFYIQAVLNGIDPMPDIPPVVRRAVEEDFQSLGLNGLLAELAEKDPATLTAIDIHNPSRVKRAMEVIRVSGKPFSDFKHGERVERPFRTIPIAILPERSLLYDRINQRTIEMLNDGWMAETESLLQRFSASARAFKTIGYAEIVGYFQGLATMDEMIRMIQQRTRNYAKTQMTWINNQWKSEQTYPQLNSTGNLPLMRFPTADLQPILDYLEAQII
jgi:tRNA dimethylallyltransferase